MLSKAVKEMLEKSNINVGGRKITNTSVQKMLVSSLLRKNVSAKKILAYTWHKSFSSLVNYGTMEHQSNILLKADSIYERHPPNPILISSPSRKQSRQASSPEPSSSRSQHNVSPNQKSTPNQPSTHALLPSQNMSPLAQQSPPALSQDSQDQNVLCRRTKRRRVATILSSDDEDGQVHTWQQCTEISL